MSANAEQARDWLLRQANPEAADAALARSLISTLGVAASARSEFRFPADGPAFRLVTGYDIDPRDRGQIPAALQKVEQAMTSATADQCEGWLVMMQAATARRSDSDVTAEVAYSLYAAELRRWPADVAKAACERIARGRPGHTGPNWFPTLAELVAECERFAAPRKALYASLQRWAPKPEYVPTARGIPEPTADEKQAVRRMAAEADAALKATAEARHAKPADLPSIAGKPDETGITAEMRAVLARQRGEV